jgi:hypothetical protein
MSSTDYDFTMLPGVEDSTFVDSLLSSDAIMSDDFHGFGGDDNVSSNEFHS